MTQPEAIIRAGRPQEAQALAALHVRVWRDTYRDLAPRVALEALDEARRLPAWQDMLARGDNVLVAEVAGDPLGVIGFGAATQSVFGQRAEIKHLYVDDAARGLGLGRRLLDGAFERLSTQGFSEAALAVVEANIPARKFYEANGGCEVARFRDEGPLWPSENVMVSWQLSDARG